MSAQSESERVAAELTAAGRAVTTVYDLVNSDQPYPELIPTLIRQLQGGLNDPRVAEGVIRALGVPEARGRAAKPLIDAFLRAPNDRSMLKWAIGNSLLIVADKTVVDDIVELVRDKTHGRAREMLVVALGKFPSPTTTATLVSLLREDDLTLHAIQAVAQQRARDAVPALASFKDDGRPAVRKAAERALARLGK